MCQCAAASPGPRRKAKAWALLYVPFYYQYYVRLLPKRNCTLIHLQLNGSFRPLHEVDMRACCGSKVTSLQHVCWQDRGSLYCPQDDSHWAVPRFYQPIRCLDFRPHLEHLSRMSPSAVLGRSGGRLSGISVRKKGKMVSDTSNVFHYYSWGLLSEDLSLSLHVRLSPHWVWGIIVTVLRRN